MARLLRAFDLMTALFLRFDRGLEVFVPRAGKGSVFVICFVAIGRATKQMTLIFVVFFFIAFSFGIGFSVGTEGA